MQCNLSYLRYGGILQRGLGHKDARVLLLILKQMQRFSQDDDLASLIGTHPIYPVAVNLMAADLNISTQVMFLIFVLSYFSPVIISTYFQHPFILPYILISFALIGRICL